MIDNKAPAALAGGWRCEADPCPVNGGIFESGDFLLRPPSGPGPAAIVSGDHKDAILTALSTRTPTTDGLGERINIEIASISFAANPEAAYQRLGRTVAEHGAEIVEALSRTPPHDTLLELLREARSCIDYSNGPTGTVTDQWTDKDAERLCDAIDAALSNHERTEG